MCRQQSRQSFGHTLADAIFLVKAGTVRPLAISRIHRSSLYTDLPTMDEAGVKGFNLDAWAGLVAPAGTPTPVVNKLNTALREIIDSPEVQARFKNVGFEGLSSTPEELGTFMRVQLGVWEKMLIPNCEFWYKANPPVSDRGPDKLPPLADIAWHILFRLDFP